MAETEIEYLFRSRLARLAASPLSRIYGLLACRGYRHSVHVGLPVISIGNIHVGGVGKTSLVAAVAREFVKNGLAPGIASRGYRGSRSAAGALVPPRGRASEFGDEPVELKTLLGDTVPISIGRDRLTAARRLLGHCRVILLDDGFQHRRLHRDLDIVLLPAGSVPERERLLPLGRLRETPASLERADAVVVVGSEKKSNLFETTRRAWASFLPKKVFFARRVLAGVQPYPGTVDPIPLLARRVVLFSGIGNPDGFAEMVRDAGAVIAQDIRFPDHHFYTETDITSIAETVRRGNALAVTTAKDAARLEYRPLPFPTAVLRTSLEAPEFLEWLRRGIEDLLERSGRPILVPKR
ncbi:MAG: tetraacyldisaccharide 4'-kinase [Candidatus Hydrogenedentota bacterium]|nr:MAG: tetraacyldisaccharide 4'-kinase [Candidatus Hydrogenedentota bacterium]